MKKLLLILFAFISFNAFSQINVKEGSFRKIDGYVDLEKDKHRDDNDNPMALIKITTEGISSEQRAEFMFDGNPMTYFDVQLKDGQTFLYITASAADFIEIIHPDFGKTKYTFPFNLCDFCGYEMVVQHISTTFTYLEVNSVPENVDVYINEEFYGQTVVVAKDLSAGEYDLKLKKEGYEEINKKIVLNEGDSLSLNETLYKYITLKTDRVGDKIYVDDKHIGVSPVTHNFLDGEFEIKVVRNERTLSKTINVVGATSHKKMDYDMSSVFGNNDTVFMPFPKMGSLNVFTQPSGASVYIDGVYSGTTPYVVDDMEIGEYKIEVEKGNYILPMEKVNIRTNKQTTIDKNLVPGKRVTIETDKDGDWIYIGKDYMGVAPLTINLVAGWYDVKVVRGDRTITKTIDIAATAYQSNYNKKNIVSIIFPKVGKLEVTTEPSGASVYIDSVFCGQTPFVKKDVLVGRREVKIVKDGFVDCVKTVKMEENETLTLKETLVQGRTVVIETDKSGDKIYVEDKYVGLSPKTVKLSYGWHNLKAKRDDDEAKLHFNVERNGKSTATLVFGKDVRFVTDHNGDYVYIDGVEVGRTPCFVYVSYGSHSLKLQRGETSITKNITVGKNDNKDEMMFELGRVVTISTTKEGDNVYIDGEHVGKTPYEQYLTFGTYDVKIKRGSMESINEIKVEEDGKKEFTLYYGPLITLSSSKKGDMVYVDGKKQGKTPIELDLSLGTHNVKVKRNRKIDTKTLTISKNGTTAYKFYPTKETINEFNNNGVRFIMASISSTPAYKYSYGMTFGAYRRVGWYMSFMSNFHFADLVDLCELTDIFDENGWYDYKKLEGKVFNSRHSASLGLMFRMGCFIYLKMGAGYGLYTTYSQSADNPFVYYDGYGEWQLLGGLQFNMKHFIMSTEIVSDTKFKSFELKLGLGFGWKKR